MPAGQKSEKTAAIRSIHPPKHLDRYNAFWLMCLDERAGCLWAFGGSKMKLALRFVLKTTEKMLHVSLKKKKKLPFTTFALTPSHMNGGTLQYPTVHTII